MNHQRILLESSPGFIFLCVLLGLAYALILYKTNKYPWPASVNKVLFGLRAVLTFLLAFLLLGPIVKHVHNLLEKPLIVFLQDNSISVKEASDTLSLKQISTRVTEATERWTDAGYEVKVTDLKGREGMNSNYQGTTSDLHGAIRQVQATYEGRKIAGVVLLSDGIYNSGSSPLHASYNFPVHTLGIGDSSQRVDLSIKNISYNKIAYQGNKFPVRIEVLVKGLAGENVTVSLSNKEVVADKQIKNSGDETLLVFDFQQLAREKGIQRIDIAVTPHVKETNIKNNKATIFIEVVEGKKKILLVSPSPHPDIKALKSVADKNSNYEFLVHIPGVIEQPADRLQPGKIDLAIFYQAPDMRGKTRSIFNDFVSKKTPVFLVVGQQSDLASITKQDLSLKVDYVPRDFDDVTPVGNASFSSFSLTSETNTQLSKFPPVSVHFGKIQLALSATPLLYQRIGNISTTKPLLAVDSKGDRKIGIMLGEGFWRWRLDEFGRVEKTEAFDEIFGKLLQFLSTADDKQKFKSYPVQQEFSDTEAVVFESQVYNDIFEPVYGSTIDIEITDEKGRKTSYSYVTSQGNTKYQIGGLPEGVYKYTSRTSVNGNPETAHGQFIVVKQLIELQNLTADFGLLRKLSDMTGGKFYTAGNIGALQDELSKEEASHVIRSEESYDALINLKWVFWILLAMVTTEWFLRRYFGGY